MVLNETQPLDIESAIPKLGFDDAFQGNGRKAFGGHDAHGESTREPRFGQCMWRDFPYEARVHKDHRAIDVFLLAQIVSEKLAEDLDGGWRIERGKKGHRRAADFGRSIRNPLFERTDVRKYVPKPLLPNHAAVSIHESHHDFAVRRDLPQTLAWYSSKILASAVEDSEKVGFVVSHMVYLGFLEHRGSFMGRE